MMSMISAAIAAIPYWSTPKPVRDDSLTRVMEDAVDAMDAHRKKLLVDIKRKARMEQMDDDMGNVF